ncbi:MAG TPA: recombinase family protein [Candidatus Omnitrophica bacterium]|nr:recombinase family protein [Candidatus Omnitrophota bacterium]
MHKYFIYARKSTDSEDRQILSIQSQIIECREFTQKEGLIVVDEFQEAKTAKSPGRPVFNRMIELIEQGKQKELLPGIRID